MTDPAMREAVKKSFFAKTSDSALASANLFFGACAKTIFDELFQNARRAGASVVSVKTSPGTDKKENTIVEIADNGRGLDDPEKLFVFGLSGWENENVKTENPAGIGFFCLSAAKYVIIESKNWRIHADRQCFKGVKKIVPEISGKHIDGFKVKFELEVHPDVVANKIMLAAKYFPLPVNYNGKEIKKSDFFEHATYIAEFDGCKIGVTHPAGKRDGEILKINFFGNREILTINFFGKTLEFYYPEKFDFFKNNPADFCADITDGRALDFVLPMREAVVQNEKFDKLIENIRRAYYAFLEKNINIAHELSFKFYKEACGMGYKIAEARPCLNPWFARSVRDREFYPSQDAPAIFREFADCHREARPDSAIIEQLYPEHTVAWFLANKTKLPFNVFYEKPEMKGYKWYPSRRMTGVTQVAETKGGTIIQLDPSDSEPVILKAGDDAEKIEENWSKRVYKSIKVLASVTDEISGEHLTFEQPAEIIFTSCFDNETDAIENCWAFSESGLDKITPEWLAILFSSPSEDCDEYEYENYRSYLLREAKRKLTALRKSEKFAAREKIKEIIQTNLEIAYEFDYCGCSEIIITKEPGENKLRVKFALKQG